MPDDNPNEVPRRNAYTPVCAIGASAGGVAALQSFFRLLPSDLGLAYVVILHLAPDHPSAMAQILGGCTTMGVHQVKDGPTLKPNCVYIIPPEGELVISGDAITVREFSGPRGQRAPIDRFFQSIAHGRGDGIAVILTGAGSDGAVGVRAIKESGGIILVQEPAEAPFPGMPQAAIATGAADFIGTIPRLAERVADVAHSKEAVRSLDPDADANDVRRIIGLLCDRTGHDFSSYKRATVLRRIARRMQVTRVDSLSDYLELLRSAPAEAKELFADLLISVTTFFRDPDAFRSLVELAIPSMFDAADDAGLRVWVAGCATGEEAYSIAILLLEEAERRNVVVPIQIFASDLDEAALMHARDARYPRSIEADVSPERLKRFFTDEGSHYRVKKEVRDLMLFASHSVLKDPPFTRLNLVACRNLLIYLERAVQQQVCSVFHYALKPDGYLFLGSAEAVESMSSQFSTFSREARLYRSKRDVSLPLPVLPQAPRVERLAYAPSAPIAVPGEFTQRFAGMHAEALEQMSPPSALVDENYNILHLSPSAGRFLLHSAGPVSNNLPSIVLPQLRLDLKLALGRAFMHEPSLTYPAQVSLGGETRLVSLHVQAAPPASGDVTRALVLFLDTGAAPEASDLPEHEARPEESRRLHGELKAAQEALVLSQHAHDITVQDLRTANEELQSINEEYRSTAEELETSKEELQSINEELQTVNAELKIKLEGISTAHNDLQNITAATDIGTLFLDTDLRIRLFTPPITDLINITAHDAGRHVTDFTHRLLYDELEEDVRRVLRTLTPLDREVRSRDGKWYAIRLRPYRTAEDRINGAVLTIIDVSALHVAEARLRQSERELRALVDVSVHVVYRMSADWTEMHELHGGQVLSDTQAPNRSWLEIYIPAVEQPRVRAMIQKAIAEKSIFDLEHQVTRADGSVGWVHSRAVPLLDAEGQITQWLGTATDTTARQLAEAALSESERRYRVLVEGVPQLVWMATNHGHWTWSSSQWHAYSGQTERESRGLGWLEAIHPDDRADVMNAWNEAGRNGTFEVECRIGRVDSGTYRWFQARAALLVDAQSDVQEWLGTSTDVDDLRRMQEQQSMMVAELQHRTRNLIGVVRSIARQTADSAKDLDVFQDKFNDRLAALSRVQGLLSRSDYEPITIGTLIRTELNALGVPAAREKVTLEGPTIVLDSRDVQTFALAIHELSINARKYGAFASSDGRLSVQWRITPHPSGDRLRLEWLEEGIQTLEKARSPGSAGYGRELIERALPYTMGAETNYEIQENFVRCTIELPRERFKEAQA